LDIECKRAGDKSKSISYKYTAARQTVIPATGSALFRYSDFANLTAFLHVLCYLHRVGFPSHWIFDFWHSVTSNNFFTDIALYLGRLPVPSTEMSNRKPLRKMRLDARLAELQVITASANLALPFLVALPSD
jgi:hypothetical protein